MERAELIAHLEHLAEYVKYSEDAPALREIIALLKTHEERTEMHACDLISKRAVEHLDWFTKLYCRDKSIADDLVFRCEQCEFELPNGRCLVKAMARKLCPDYKDFEAMGDL